MADIVHEHTIEKEGSGVGFLMGALLLIVVIFLFFYFALPYLRSTTSSPQINVPGKIDVYINQPSK